MAEIEGTVPNDELAAVCAANIIAACMALTRAKTILHQAIQVYRDVMTRAKHPNDELVSSAVNTVIAASIILGDARMILSYSLKVNRKVKAQQSA